MRLECWARDVGHLVEHLPSVFTKARVLSLIPHKQGCVVHWYMLIILACSGSGQKVQGHLPCSRGQAQPLIQETLREGFRDRRGR